MRFVERDRQRLFRIDMLASKKAPPEQPEKKLLLAVSEDQWLGLERIGVPVASRPRTG